MQKPSKTPAGVPTPSPLANPFACASPNCGCGPRALPRRDFLKLGGLAATALAFAHLPAMAGPFTREDFDRLVPADKKLDPAWVKSLFARGSKTVYRWPESDKIGMPVGGLCAGQLYLGGDGKLWHWDIFNQFVATNESHYAQPPKPASPLEQGFALRIASGGQAQVRPLDHTGWSDIAFNGEYPHGCVTYRDPASPVSVALEAFSPFIPLNTEDSALPATVMRFTVQNTSAQPVECDLAGWLQNAAGLRSGRTGRDVRQNRIRSNSGWLFLECGLEGPAQPARRQPRPEIVFDDFERETYEDWTATGDAFGRGPVAQDKMPEYQGKVGAHGQRTVNSHASAPGNDVAARDAATGTLTSKPFTLERDFIQFLIGGGAHRGRTCLNLIVEGQAVDSFTGANDNRMKPGAFDVRGWQDRTARLQIVDQEKGAWGNIGVDHIVFSDVPGVASARLEDQPDFGSLGLALLDAQRGDGAVAQLPMDQPPLATVFTAASSREGRASTNSFEAKSVGALRRKLKLAPGRSATVTFVVTWFFPNFKLDGLRDVGGRWYGKKFASAFAVAEYVARHFDRLASQTRLWHDTWYDSTLPYWLLDRSFLNTSILATNTCYWFGNGRFWAWEGVGCCHGTCGHVWQYAQAMARLFPALERDTRERVDFGLALQPDGAIYFRGEFNDYPAVDGQAGTILRAWREHQMSADDAWLRRQWPGIKRAIGWLIAKDGDGDGLIVGNQHNTLDTDWFGPVAWLSGMYLAALRAGEAMAQEVGDAVFARQCREIFERGQPRLVAELFDGEYFINQPDPKHLEAINSGTGCHIDQVLGQSWAGQVGLGRVLPVRETLSALRSLWRYNFAPDVGPYRRAYPPGRWYAMPGEGGLLMCSFPRRDWDYANAKGQGPDWAAGYFNECMNGFEYQVAWHMVAEGMLTEGLAIARMVHDRYHAARRNPWNEVECGDHYARSMASYGVFLAACGYEYHGPKEHLGFAPRLTPENFRCAFTTAEGWGMFSQTTEAAKLRAQIDIRWGKLRLRTFSLAVPPQGQPTKATVKAGSKSVPATLAVADGKAVVTFGVGVTLKTGARLQVELG